MNFYDTLNSEQLKRELVSRGIFDFPSTKKGMVDELKGHLCGVQRVPALLLLNPVTDLLDMNLITYTVLSFEPLHDLKGNVKRELVKRGIRNTEHGIQNTEYGIRKMRNTGIKQAICCSFHFKIRK